MADPGSGGPIGGDILGALSGDVSIIRSDTSHIRTNTDALASMEKDISAILKSIGGWSQQNARSRIYDTTSGSSGSSTPYDRRPGNNRDRSTPGKSSKNSGRPEEFIDSFFEEIEKEMFGAGFKHAMQQNMKDFAAAMGLQVQDLPAAFGKAFANQIKQTKIGKDISSRMDGLMDGAFNRYMSGMKSGIERYYDRMKSSGKMSGEEADAQQSKWNEVMDRMRENYRNRRTTPENDPTPGGSDEGESGGSGGSGNDSSNKDENGKKDDAAAKILDDKLQYLYPIYNSISTINEAVKLIADCVGASETDKLKDLQKTFDENNKSNSDFIDGLLKSNQGDDGVGDIIKGGLDGLLGGGGGLDIGAGLAGMAGGLASVNPYILAFKAGLWLADKALDKFKECFAPLQETFDDFKKELKNTTNRFFVSERKKIQQETDRLREDVKTLIETPFDILKDAAEEWYNTWDNNLKTINATQGYTKADLQTLMGNYSERLRSENLASVVSAADISSNLAKVLESGLSGKAAEEFAYLATILNNAIPTEDFFGYASTYATIAANQIAMGKSQSEALSAANDQLTQFASNLLYSNRELAGGFSTGLKDASNILEGAVKIATTSGIGDSSYISAVLTAISSTVGAVAPDLAGSVTDAIIDAALGGNTDELVALRSLANTGASNTAFLNAFARDPKGVLMTLFSNLGNMQRMNNANFMEVAENLSKTFGLSLGAFTRIDFDMVTRSVANMDVTTKSLDQNIKLLQDGQTTTTAEQLKMQKVNEMILNEGLSYVLDNQAARAIQQHMWDQELAAELMEAEYSVDLTGKALEFLSGIKETINNILNFLNPFSWLNKIVSVFETAAESAALKGDIRQVLEAGKVGQGNADSIYNLTTYDVDRLTNKPGNLAQMMGKVSAFSTLRTIDSVRRSITSLGLESNYSVNGLINSALKYGANGLLTLGKQSGAKSQYGFATKGLYGAIMGNNFSGSGGRYGGTQGMGGYEATPLSSTQSKIASKAETQMQGFLDTMEAYVAKDQSFKNWAKTASNYGIQDLDAALKQYGLTRADLEGKYQEYQASKASEYDYNRDKEEKELWDKLKEFMNEDMSQFFEEVKTKMDRQIELLESIDSSLTTFMTRWTADWLYKSWNINWLQKSWGADWIKQAWGTDWLEKAWSTDWVQGAWRTEWLENAWRMEWLQGAWQKAWLEDAWQSSWLDDAWGEKWLKNAWQTDWLDTAWRKEWLQDAWTNGFLLMWKTEWLQKAWNQNWLNKGWNQNWLKGAWQKDWLEKAWGNDWLNLAWKLDWLEKAWQSDWLNTAWKSNWLETAWAQDWLKQAWNTDWIKNAWGIEWLDQAWRKDWIETAFNQKFVHDLIQTLWGNRWWDFFNIFRDRFGGITTEAGNGIDSGKTTIDTEGLYQIYAQETGKAAENALKELQDRDETGDAILALTKELTKNTVDLRDPQVQTNVLLSQILVVLEAIMQAENVSGGASLATTLAALGMGLTTPNVTPGAINGGGVVTL